MAYQALPIGVENFEDIITEEYYYVDKTLFIRELLDKKAKVNVFTRPRRFGKTLLLSTIRFFFEDAYDFRGNKKDYSSLFEGMKIMEAGERYTKHMGQYPVISLSLKSGKQAKFDSCMEQLRIVIEKEFDRHSYILKDNVLSNVEKKKYEKYLEQELADSSYKSSLKFLSECLEKWYGKKVIILIDEYDVPLEGAYVNGFYDEMVDFVRGLFEHTLKTNDSLYFSVVTGCLRIAKESIFTGLNHLDINSVTSEKYGEYFGFTDEEVQRICDDYSLSDKYIEMKDWYNGYIFGRANVYNPWSTIKYVADHAENSNAFPKAYWANTSSNSIVRDLINRSDSVAREELELLMSGGSLEIMVHEDITYDEIYNSPENLWNFMFYTGYFKKVAERFSEEQGQIYITIQIPNREINTLFKQKVEEWFKEQVKQSDRTALIQAFLSDDVKTVEKELGRFLLQTISYNDYHENFYHAFVAGILVGIDNYIVKSNREGGCGRSDLFVKSVDRNKTAYVVEFKIAGSLTELKDKAEAAVQQIIDKNYEQELLDDGYLTTKRYGIAFFKKNCCMIQK